VEGKKMKTITVFSLVLCMFVSMSEANMLKGSCPAGGHKSFGFIANTSGQVTITLIYDSKSADLDLIAGTSIQGETVILGIAFGKEQNYERLEFSVAQGAVIAFLVDSYKGASPFRVYVSTGESETAFPVSAVEIKSDSVTERMLMEVKKIRK
jgi:hypothetical protein